MKLTRSTILLAAIGLASFAAKAGAQEDQIAPAALVPQAAIPAQPTDAASQPSNALTASAVCSPPACACCDQCTSGCDCNNPSGYTFQWAPDRWMNISPQVRATYNNTSDSLQPPGTRIGSGNFLAVNDARLFFTGKVHENIGFEMSMELFPVGAKGFESINSLDSFGTAPEYQLLDADVRFECDDFMHVWVGQFRPPADRQTLDGPFFINAWDLVPGNYPNLTNGRELGAVYWGEAGGGMLQWSAGVFNGTGRLPAGNAPNLNGNPLQFAGRVEINLLDPDPGYYKQSTYYGKKDLLTFAAVVQTQKDALGTAPDSHDFTGWNVEELFETKLDNDGVITLESAYYSYSTQHLNDTTTTLLQTESAIAGQSGFVYAGYLMPEVLCLGCYEGRLRPFYRYLDYNHTNSTATALLNTSTPGTNLYSTGNDVGCDYIIRGHNARLTAFWGNRILVGDGTINIFRIGAQIVF